MAFIKKNHTLLSFFLNVTDFSRTWNSNVVPWRVISEGVPQSLLDGVEYTNCNQCCLCRCLSAVIL